MRPRRLSIPLSLGLAAACSGPPGALPEEPRGPPEASAVVFQAVDAGTGAALRDAELTVRYLVRSPIALDVASVERVSSLEPYRISHEVADDALVVEVRLEAPSYHRLDTALSVPRGGAVGPLTLRMARRLGQLAESEPDAPLARPVPPRVSGGAAQPGASTTSPPREATVGPDRSALEAGDRAFQRGDWLAATEAYRRMAAPADETGEYARLYQQALVRRGIAHMNRGEYGSALEVLEEAAELDSAGFNTHLRLSQAQCAVGRTAEGRGTLAVLGRSANRMPANTRALVGALVQYQTGVCTHGEFDRANTTRDRVRMGAAAIQELEAFTAEARGISPAPRQLEAAVEDAERRIQLIRGRIRG